MIQAYDKKLADKDAYIKELADKISKLEQEIRDTTNEFEQLEKLMELRQTAKDKMIIENGTNEEIADWLIENAETLERAAKIQKRSGW